MLNKGDFEIYWDMVLLCTTLDVRRKTFYKDSASFIVFIEYCFIDLAESINKELNYTIELN